MTNTVLDPRFDAEEVWLPFSESLFEWDARFHDLMLNDRIRVSAYRAAIRQSVKPGMTVLDLGTGTGILALWALEAGASRVYGVEMSQPILDLAIQRIADAGYGEKFTPICDLSFNVTLPNRVNVLISEIIGNLADNENFVPILSDATDRFLELHGVQIPGRVVSYIVPVEAKSAHEQIVCGRWRAFSPAQPREDGEGASVTGSHFDLYYDAILPLSSYVAEPKELRRYNGSWKESPTYSAERVWRVARSGLITGFKGYFIAELADGILLDISGDDVNGRTSSDSWKHAYLPIESPIAVEAGDMVQLEFSRTVVPVEGRWGRQVYSWSGQVRRQGQLVGGFHQSTGRD